MRLQADHNYVVAAFNVSRESLVCAWAALQDAGIIGCSYGVGGSFVNRQAEACGVREAMCDLYESLPKGCPQHLLSLAKLD